MRCASALSWPNTVTTSSEAARNNLENKLEAQLPDARITRTGDHAEIAAAEVAAWIVELRVIEGIEEFGAEFERHRFINVREFHQRHIPVGKTRSGDEAAVRRSKLTEALRSESTRQEISILAIGAGLMGILSLHRTDQIRRIGIATTGQRIVSALAQPYGKAGGQARNAIDLPTLRPLALWSALEKAVERKGPTSNLATKFERTS